MNDTEEVQVLGHWRSYVDPETGERSGPVWIEPHVKVVDKTAKKKAKPKPKKKEDK
jgi:hypothetical protein